MSETGERMGTYNGHLGAVWDLDPTWYELSPLSAQRRPSGPLHARVPLRLTCRDSTFLATAGSDQKVIVWEVETGIDLITYNHSGPVRCVSWNEAGSQFVSCSDKFSDNMPCVTIYVSRARSAGRCSAIYHRMRSLNCVRVESKAT